MKALLFVLFFTLAVLGCGGKKEAGDVKSGMPDLALDDAFALLPGQPIAVATLDARAFFGSDTFGAEIARLTERWVPIGEEAGFRASRDVDRISLGVYSYQGADVAAIVVGRFDVEKIRHLALGQALTGGGALLVVSQYAGRDVYTVSNVGFSLLSNERAVVGTESGIRRVLERIQDRRVRRDITPWMIQTMETPGAALAVAADLATQPAPGELMQQVPMAWVKEIRAARVVATFEDPGVHLAGSLSYADEDTAKTASEAVRQTANLAQWLALIGVRLQNVKVAVERSDVQVQLGIDDRSLGQLLSTVPRWTGP
jgi:hypothetical protein